VSERLGQQFIVENRPGAGSNIATEAVVRAPPDGMLISSSNAIKATLYDKLNTARCRPMLHPRCLANYRFHSALPKGL
jgi:tripartite-type tricarboxylate transporter receptor subunit TctC